MSSLLQKEPDSRPELLGEKPASSRSTGPLGVSWILWILLAVSLSFLVAVRIYIAHQERDLSATAGPVEGVPLLMTHTAGVAFTAGELRLRWDTVPGAADYRLRVSTLAGDVVLDHLPVAATSWSPPEDALPALTSGDYQWQVEALDPDGKLLARSLHSMFRIGQ